MITQDIVREKLIYDPEIGIFVWRKNKKIAGTLHKKGYINIRFLNRNLTAHRLAWIYAHNHIPEGMFIDHINGIRNDNRISNLRLLTPYENCLNRPINRNPTKLQQHLKNKATLLTGILTLS